MYCPYNKCTVHIQNEGEMDYHYPALINTLMKGNIILSPYQVFIYFLCNLNRIIQSYCANQIFKLIKLQ